MSLNAPESATESHDTVVQKFEGLGVQPKPHRTLETTSTSETSMSETAQVTGAALPYRENMAKEIQKPALDVYSSDTEDELEIVKILRTKAASEKEARRFDVAERVQHKVVVRFRNLCTRRPASHQQDVIDAIVGLAQIQACQGKWDEGVELISELIQNCPKANNDQALQMLQAEFYLEKKDLNTARNICSSVLKIRRRLFGKQDPRYYDVLVLKVRILWAQGEEDDAEAYLTMLPENYRAPTTNMLTGYQHNVPEVTTGGSQVVSQEWIKPSSQPNMMKKDVWELAQFGRASEVIALVEDGLKFDMTAKNESGETLLVVATRCENLSMVNFFVGRGRKDKQQALLSAIGKGDAELVKVLLKTGVSVEHNVKQGFQPLHHVAENNRSEIAKILIDHGTDITAKSANGNTPLHIAVRYDANETASVIVEKARKDGTLSKMLNDENRSGLKVTDRVMSPKMKKVLGVR